MLNKELIQEKVEELQRLEKRQHHSAVSYRVRMLRLLKGGECRSIAAAAKELGYSLRQCQRWWQSYREGGVGTLMAFEQPRRSERMTTEAWEALFRAMKAGEVATLEEARQLLLQQGVYYQGVAGVSALLIRHKVKLKTGRPRHRKSDEAIQEMFKKTLLSS